MAIRVAELPIGLSRFDLRLRTAVVIGGTGALGGAIAQGLGDAGARVAIVGRNAQHGEERVRLIRERGGEAFFFPADALDKSSLEQARLRINTLFNAPDILVNAAGGNKKEAVLKPIGAVDFEGLQLADWATVFDLNLVGGILFPCQVFGPAMLMQRHGSIINIASVSAHLPLTRVIAYSAAKAAVLNLSQSLATLWAQTGVRVNTLTPGFFPAEQNMKLLFNQDETPTARGLSILNHTGMRRFGKPEELVGAALFLASDAASSFVTGSDIVVDGGFLAQTI